MSSKPLIYLASPYTSRENNANDRKFQEAWRFNAVRDVALKLHRAGHLIFSPISYSHQFATEFLNIGGCWETWKELDSALVSRCDELWVLKLDGWDTSTGVRAECELARSLGKPVAYILKSDVVPEYEVF